VETKTEGRIVALLGAVVLAVGIVLIVTDRNPGVGTTLVIVGIVAVVVGLCLDRVKDFRLPGGGGVTLYEQRDISLELSASELELKVADVQVEATPQIVDAPLLETGTAVHPPAIGVSPAVIAARIEQELDDESSDEELVGAFNHMVANVALAGILATATEGPLRECDLRLYLYDPDADDGRGWLNAIYEPEKVIPDSRGWPPGKGATGTAWATGEYVVATGEQCWNSTFGVPADRSDAYKHLKAVAACPIFNASWTMLGVVSAESTIDDHGLTTEEAETELLACALQAGRVLVELLKWFNDD
jgi:hypothetical protein